MALGSILLRRIARIPAYLVRRRVVQFEKLCENPEALQSQILFNILRTQTRTGFGKDHGFQSIRTLEDYRRQVPIAPYERHQPYIERMANGETNALLANGPVRLFALTSGTTASRKLIPVNDAYLHGYRSAWNMWGARMYRDHRPRKLFLRPIVQMTGSPIESYTKAGIPCGNMSGYTTMVQKSYIRWLYALPYQLGMIKDSHTKNYLAARLTMGRPCSLFMAANPSTLLQLARTLGTETEALLKDLTDGTLNANLDIPSEIRAAITPRLKANPTRARELGLIATKKGTLLPSDCWPPDSILIATWTGGSMGAYLRQLPAYYGNAPIRDLGLLASEGRFSIPFANDTPSGVLDVASNYFEFVPEGEIDSPNPTVLGAHEVKEGGRYYILPTTWAGLYRYHISDVVGVTGFLGRTPTIEFLGKGSRFANITGEKLSEHHVTKAFDSTAPTAGFHLLGGYALAPVWRETTPYYGLFVEEKDRPTAEVEARFLKAFESQLDENNVEYASKRESGRLSPVVIHVVPNGFWLKWDADQLANRGGTAEQFKHPCLIGDAEFAKKLLK